MELVRQKNVATIIVFPLIDADGDTVSGSANPDSEIDDWTDGAAPDGFADCTNEATEIGVTGVYYLSLTQGEMNKDYIYIQIKSDDAKTQHILIRTTVGDPLNIATTTSGRLIDTETTGEVGLNFDNIKNASTHTTLNISVNVALDTTLAVRTSDTIFTINAGSTVNDAYNNMVLALYDVSGTLWETRKIDDYNGADKKVTVDTAFTFVVAANDVVKIFMNAYAPTVAAGGGATAAQVWDYDVSGVTTQGYAGTYQKIAGGRYG